MRGIKQHIRACRIKRAQMERSLKEWQDYTEALKSRDIDALLGLFLRYCEVEQEIIATNPTLIDVDQDNLSHSYKWLPFPVQDGMPQTPERLSLSDVELFPNDFLAAVLVKSMRTQVPNGIHCHSILVHTDSKTSRFCISGSVSSESLQKIFWHLQAKHDSADEK